MKPAELRASVGKTPFRPFRLKLRDGREIVCDDPDGWCIAETGSTMLIIRRGREPYIRLTAAEVASVEPHD